MKKTRMIAGLCAVVVASGFILSGCGSKEVKENSAGETKKEAATAADDVKSSKLLTLSVEMFDRGNAPKGTTAEDNPITQWVKKEVKDKLNVDVKFVPVPRSQEYDKLNVMMASNNAPDIVFTNKDFVPKGFAKSGGLTDLGPYIEKFGKALKTNVGEDILKKGQYFGKQYAIPAKQNIMAAHATFIRKDWVDKLGARVPTKKDEFYALLKRFKSEDPGKVGKDSVIPYAMAAGNTEKYYENFIMSFVKKNDKEEAIYTGILKYLTPGTKEGFKVLNSWYNEGLISKDFALDTSEKKFVQDITTGKVGAFTVDQTQVFGWLDAFKKNVPDGEYWPIDAFENGDGTYWKDAGTGLGLKIMVPKANEKNAEAVIRYLNWMSDKKVYANIKYGVEGENFTYDKDGIPAFTGKTGDRQKKGIADTFMFDTAIIYSDLIADSEDKKVVAFVKQFPGYEKTASELWKIIRGKGVYTQYYYSVPIDAENKYGSSLQTMLRNMAPKLIISKPADFDKLYEDEVKKVMEGGAKQLIEERTKYYESNIK